METTNILLLMEEYLHCPKCGNSHVGNGEGTISVTSNQFTRTCKCGFKKTITLSNKTNNEE